MMKLVTLCMVLALTTQFFMQLCSASDDPNSVIPVELPQLASQLKAQVDAHTNSLTSQQTQINTINSALAANKVAFAASISHEPTVAASEGGGAYNPSTSAFTAPSAGYYMFFVRVDISHDCFGVDIRVNNARKVAANNDGYISTHVSAAGVLQLHAGDVVTVTYFSTHGFVDAGIESVFTGFRLF